MGIKDFLTLSAQKNGAKIRILDNFPHFGDHILSKLDIKSPIHKIAPKNSITLFPYMLWSSGKNFRQGGQKMKGVKILA